MGHRLVHMFELSIPILLPIWMGAFDITVATAGVVASLGYAAFGAGALPGGVLADRYGSTPLVAGSLLGIGGAFLLLLFARSVATFTLALVLWGAAASVYHPAALALISTGVEKRGRGFAYHGIAGNVGTALGPLAVVLLLAERDWPTAVVALSGAAVVAGLFAVVSDVEEDRTAEGDAPPTATADGGLPSLSGFATASRRLFAGGFALVFVAVVFEGIYYRGYLPSFPESSSPYSRRRASAAIARPPGTRMAPCF